MLADEEQPVVVVDRHDPGREPLEVDEAVDPRAPVRTQDIVVPDGDPGVRIGDAASHPPPRADANAFRDRAHPAIVAAMPNRGTRPRGDARDVRPVGVPASPSERSRSPRPTRGSRPTAGSRPRRPALPSGSPSLPAESGPVDEPRRRRCPRAPVAVMIASMSTAFSQARAGADRAAGEEPDRPPDEVVAAALDEVPGRVHPVADVDAAAEDDRVVGGDAGDGRRREHLTSKPPAASDPPMPRDSAVAPCFDAAQTRPS